LPRSKMGIRSARTDTLHTLSPEEAQVLRAAAQSGGLKSLLGERRLNKVLDRIESQPACSVGELAIEVQLSPAHLQRLFKQKTGRHLSDLIGEHRLQKAARMLSSTDLAIKEIAHAVGYEHHSSFVRAFQRRFEQSPKYYRLQSYRIRSESFHVDEKAAAD
jgi:transcriptional regulator GlxA family with amidase domain